jgi:GH15 family glucan-1,4-alpha-glucosidase
MSDLRQHSINVILANQAPSGAFVACPTMPDYQYSWFRDGSYIAYALDLSGQPQAAHRFHDWAAGVIAANASAVERAEACITQNLPPDEQAVLHTRYTVEGQVGSDAWPNFQLDGIGTWLWAVCDHVARHAEPLPALWREAGALAGRYLVALWRQPNFDLWEENGEHRHTYTQAAIYGGLAAAGELLDRPDWQATAAKVHAELMLAASRQGHFTKFLPGASHVSSGQALAVDGALIGVALPHGVVPPEHPALVRTVELIERDLRREGGGVHRFAWDVYYGGGEWVLLTAWLGWYYAESGQPARARELLAWCEAQADPHGDLPEQVPQHLMDPSTYQPWVDVRGPIARPLLWSHAKYLILCHALDRSAEED